MKQNTPQWATTLTALILGVTLSGCATSFQQNSLAAVDSFPEVSSEKSIAVDLAFSGKLNGKPWIAENTHNTAYLKNRCIEQLNDSGMFGVVSPNLGATDLTLHVAIINEKNTDSSSELLTALTLFIVPYKSTDTFRLLALVKEPKTGRQKRIELEERVSHYQQILMAPFALFKSQDNELEKCRTRLLDTLCLEIQKSGFLDD